MEEKWTYSCNNNLDNFAKTINSRVNRITKLAPNKVTKREVPRIVSLTVETPAVINQNFMLVTVRIVKKEESPKRIQTVVH